MILMVKFKKKLLDLYTFTILSKEKENHYQKIARDEEWKEIKKFIPKNIHFIDVGCGAGYYLEKAKNELECTVVGIDPEPGNHGVNRYNSAYYDELNIRKGSAESIEFENNSFDVVFSSHVLEHVSDIDKSLSEMKRVAKDEATIVIGVPTSTMAFISLYTQILFTSHIRFVNFFFKPFIKTARINFNQVFFGYSHSYPENKTTLYDIKHYKTNVWKSYIEKYFTIDTTIFPALYPYPNYLQIFKMKKRKNKGSSVFFICRKK